MSYMIFLKQSLLRIYLSLMSKEFTNDKWIINRYGSKMKSVKTNDPLHESSLMSKGFSNDKRNNQGYDGRTNSVKDKGSDDITWMMIWKIWWHGMEWMMIWKIGCMAWHRWWCGMKFEIIISVWHHSGEIWQIGKNQEID